jgi:ParB/RepB/Spo0J family partition protein
VQLIELEHVHDDPDFHNMRLAADTDYEGGRLEELKQSMQTSGLKIPIAVIEDETCKGRFFARAGFRRLRCAKELGWKKIPAFVLPMETPVADQYWLNIIENASRKTLTSYELACSAKHMRDEFRVKPADFATRVGMSESYIRTLLQLVDDLPDEILDFWKETGRPSVETLRNMLLLGPYEAVEYFRKLTGQRPGKNLESFPERRTSSSASGGKKLVTATGLYRMQRLQIAVETAMHLDDSTRRLCLGIIDFCTGAASKVPGLYDPKRRRRYRDDVKELRLPDLPDHDSDDSDLPGSGPVEDD